MPGAWNVASGELENKSVLGVQGPAAIATTQSPDLRE